MKPVKTILHPTDFSETSQYALDLACALARDQRSRLLLLHVLPGALSPAEGDMPHSKSQHAEADLEAYRREMTGMLAKARDKTSYANVETALKEGPVAETIIRTAVENNCDLIVMGSHGRSRLYDLTMGSVAAAVTRNTGCPVVTVKAPVPK
jgi:nucleotide-binding universal stress UspA family protein